MIVFNLKEIDELIEEAIKTLETNVHFNSINPPDEFHLYYFEHDFLKIAGKIQQMSVDSNNDKAAQHALVDLFFSKKVANEMKLALDKDIVENNKVVNKETYMLSNLIDQMTKEIATIHNLSKKTNNNQQIIVEHFKSLLN